MDRELYKRLRELGFEANRTKSKIKISEFCNALKDNRSEIAEFTPSATKIIQEFERELCQRERAQTQMTRDIGEQEQ
jgi:hypothetical protein